MHTKNNNPIALGCIYSNPKNIFMNGRGCVYHSNGIAPTILTMSGGGNKPFVVVESKISKVKGEGTK